MSTFYVRAGGGNSNDTNTYSLSGSGGAAAGVLPTSADDVILEAGSGNFTVNANFAVRSLDCNSPSGSGAYAGVFTQNASVNINIGDGVAGLNNIALRFSSGMTYTRGGSANINFEAGPSTPAQGIITAGKALGTTNIGNTASGNWELLDAYNSAGSFVWVRGTFRSNGYSMTALTFSRSGSNVLDINIEGTTLNSTATGGFTMLSITSSTNLTFSADTAILTFVSSSSSKSVQLAGVRFGTLKYDNNNSTGQLTFGANVGTVLKLIFNDATAVRNIAFAASGWDIRDWSEVYGRSGANISIISTSVGVGRYLKIGSPSIQTVNYCTIRDVYLRTPAKFFALNSTDNGNNKNLTFGAAGAHPYNRQAVIDVQASVNNRTLNFDHQAVAGNLLIATLSFIADPGTIVVPSGWLLAHEHARGTANYVKVYYKVSDGTESSVTFSWTTARTCRVSAEEWYNFQGVPTLDTVDQADTGSTNTQSTGAGATNSAAPALSYAVLSANGGMGLTTSDPTNGFGNYWDTTIETSGAISKYAAKVVTDIASRTTTFAWTTARQTAAVLINFIDAPAGNMIKVKVAGTFVEKRHKAKVSGVFV